MNQTANITGAVDELAHASGPALIAVAVVGLAVVIGSIIIDRLSHSH